MNSTKKRSPSQDILQLNSENNPMIRRGHRNGDFRVTTGNSEKNVPPSLPRTDGAQLQAHQLCTSEQQQSLKARGSMVMFVHKECIVAVVKRRT